MTGVKISASERQKPATPAPVTPQQQTRGTPATPADKPSEQQK